MSQTSNSTYRTYRGSHLQDMESTVDTAVALAKTAAEAAGPMCSEITVAYQGISITMKPQAGSEESQTSAKLKPIGDKDGNSGINEG